MRIIVAVALATILASCRALVTAALRLFHTRKSSPAFGACSGAGFRSPFDVGQRVGICIAPLLAPAAAKRPL
jgi:hypothetical protein